MNEQLTTVADLDFSIDRRSPMTLAEQVAVGFQGAIQSGALTVGDRLPGIREIASQLGVSYVVANQAVRRLADQGFVVSRRRTGIHVAAGQDKVWKAHVLWLTPAPASWFFSARQQSFLQALSERDIRASTVCLINDSEQVMLKQLWAALETMSLSAIVCSPLMAGTIAACAEHEVPLIACDDGLHEGVAGCLVSSSRQALQALAVHCHEVGQECPAILSAIPHLALEVEREFSRHGLLPQVVATGDWGSGEGRVEQTERLGYEVIGRLLESNALPRLLVVTDDYVARGCLTALLQHGVRIPHDLQLVICGNRRHLPAFNRPFTRIERDPDEVGRQLAELVTEVIDAPAALPIVRSVEARFIPGGTTLPAISFTV